MKEQEQDSRSNHSPVPNWGEGRALQTLSKVAKFEHRLNLVTAPYTVRSSDSDDGCTPVIANDVKKKIVLILRKEPLRISLKSTLQ